MKSTKPEPFRSRWRQDIALYRGDELIDSGTIKRLPSAAASQRHDMVVPYGRRA
jgi:hypothetical protein